MKVDIMCVRCATKRVWPEDFPNSTYAICRSCMKTEIAEMKVIEARTNLFFTVLAAVGLAIAVALIVVGIWFR